MHRHSNVEVVAASTTSLTVFIPDSASPRGSLWTFVRTTTAATHLDMWRLSSVFAVHRLEEYSYIKRVGGNSLTHATSTWEHAIKIGADADFSGVNAHGWEKLEAVTFLADGKPWTPAVGSFTCREFRVIQETNLLRWKATEADSEDKIADVTMNYVFTRDGLRLRQSIRFAASLTVAVAYICMFPVLRTVGDYQISSFETRNNNGTPYNIATAGFTEVPALNVKELIMWDAASELVFRWSQTLSTGAETTTWVSSAAQYNKLYRQACAFNTAVTSATVWETEHLFSIGT